MNKIKVLRIQAKLDIKTAAQLLCIKTDTLYKLERGKRKPGPALKFKISILYGININEL